jgi:hypothetical protein
MELLLEAAAGVSHAGEQPERKDEGRNQLGSLLYYPSQLDTFVTVI